MLKADYFRDILAPTTKSASMLKTRSSYLAQLHRLLDSTTTDLSFLNDTRGVLKLIRDSTNVNTQKTRIFHVMSILRTKAASVVDKSNKDLYGKIAAKLKADGLKAYDQNIMTAKQKERYMSMSGLVNALSRSTTDLFNEYGLQVPLTLENNTTTIEERRGATITDENFARLNVENTRGPNIYTFARELQALVLLHCYVHQPALRNDYGTLHITRKVIGLTKDHNWIQFRKNGTIAIVMNQYKNVKSLGKQTIEINSPRLRWALHYWWDLLTRLLSTKPVTLFYYTINANHTIKPVADARSLSRQLPRFSEKYLTKPLTINDYRHIWETHIQGTDAYKKMTVNERTAMHNKLLHGHLTGIQYASIRRGYE
jgi:hypothetical protein